MNHREPSHLPTGARRALHCLSLLLLPALAPEGAHALPRSGEPAEGDRAPAPPVPYLPVFGAPALRFREAAPPPDLVTRPPAAAPPQPALTPTENSVAADNAAAARSVAAPDAPETDDAPAAETKPAAKETPPPAKVPAAILRDDTRPSVRAEDFLPFFQIPGSTRQPGDVNLLVPVAPAAPAPAPLPPSTATYTQTK